MSIVEIIYENSQTIIAIIAAISGSLITHLFHIIQKKSEWKHEKDMQEMERYFQFDEKYLIYPIIEFIETELILMQTIYSKGFDKETAKDDFELFNEHYKKLLLTSAKLRVYGDDNLINKFKEFTEKRIDIGNYIFNENDRNINNAFENIKKAETLAGDILKTMKNKLKAIKN